MNSATSSLWSRVFTSQWRKALRTVLPHKEVGVRTVGPVLNHQGIIGWRQATLEGEVAVDYRDVNILQVASQTVLNLDQADSLEGGHRTSR